MKFRLEIQLGNDAMRTFDDIATLLARLAWYLEDHGGDHDPKRGGETVRDVNGNAVGHWEIR